VTPLLPEEHLFLKRSSRYRTVSVLSIALGAIGIVASVLGTVWVESRQRHETESLKSQLSERERKLSETNARVLDLQKDLSERERKLSETNAKVLDLQAELSLERQRQKLDGTSKAPKLPPARVTPGP